MMRKTSGLPRHFSSDINPLLIMLIGLLGIIQSGGFPFVMRGTPKSSKPWTTMTQYWNNHGEDPRLRNFPHFFFIQDDKQDPSCRTIQGFDSLYVDASVDPLYMSGIIRDEETTSETGATGSIGFRHWPSGDDHCNSGECGSPILEHHVASSGAYHCLSIPPEPRISIRATDQGNGPEKCHSKP